MSKEKFIEKEFIYILGMGKNTCENQCKKKNPVFHTNFS